MKAIAYPAPRTAIAALLLAMAGSCSAPPRPAPQPAPAPRPAPVATPAPPPAAPRPAANWRDAPITPGDWSWGIVAGRSTASFGMPGAAPLATLACDKGDGEVWLSRTGTGQGHVPAALTTMQGSSPLTTDPELARPGWVTIAIRTSDPILDSVAFSRGRFAFDLAGNAPLYLPSWPEVSRVIEDCR